MKTYVETMNSKKENIFIIFSVIKEARMKTIVSVLGESTSTLKGIIPKEIFMRFAYRNLMMLYKGVAKRKNNGSAS